MAYKGSLFKHTQRINHFITTKAYEICLCSLNGSHGFSINDNILSRNPIPTFIVPTAALTSSLKDPPLSDPNLFTAMAHSTAEDHRAQLLELVKALLERIKDNQHMKVDNIVRNAGEHLASPSRGWLVLWVQYVNEHNRSI